MFNPNFVQFDIDYFAGNVCAAVFTELLDLTINWRHAELAPVTTTKYQTTLPKFLTS